MSKHWIDDADHWICPNCGFITSNPNRYAGCKCPKCGFQDEKDKAESEDKVEWEKDKECWIFTFGVGHSHPGYYVKIYGSYGEAKMKMVEKYGIKWAFQHSLEEWEEWEKERPWYMPKEKELEVIE